MTEPRAGGLFVAFEGGEGAGKSTQIESLARHLERAGRRVVVTREPGGTSIGKRIRDILLDATTAGMDARTEALLYAADRAQHAAEVIRPALESGAVVVSDRFVDSSLAYQGLARGLGLERIFELSSWATGGLLPDLVFVLDVAPETGLDRVGATRDRLESEGDAFHSEVRRAYLKLAAEEPDRFAVIDAGGAAQDVASAVVAAFQERLGS